jgi:hypothetical protein
MEVQLDRAEQFAIELFGQLQRIRPQASSITCYWAATYGAHMFAAYATKPSGEIEMLLNTEDAGKLVFREWSAQHGLKSVTSYEEWVRQAPQQKGNCWNWGWASDSDPVGRVIHLFYEPSCASELPSQQQVDIWLKQQFGSRSITYPSVF